MIYCVMFDTLVPNTAIASALVANVDGMDDENQWPLNRR
jgi:hypothetical protein